MAQTVNFDQTWKEFLENNKISNMSELVKPDRAYNQPAYAKYLLMNTNTSFCQSDVADAEKLMTEVQAIDGRVLEAIPGFLPKMEDLNNKIGAYHSMDAVWKRFLQTRSVTLEELDAIAAAKTSCEKRTLAKYSYMMAYAHLCRGELANAKDIFENRTLRLTEKTTLRVQDVEGLAGEVARLKSWFQDQVKLDAAWANYMRTGRSPGFETELPLFPCYPIPNMKALVLKGAVDICNLAPTMLAKIRQLQAESNVTPDGELAVKLKELEAAVQQKEGDLATLNAAWAAFLPNNKVTHFGKYGYDYCAKEPLIRAYIMDGFAYTCELGEEMLRKIDSMQRKDMTPLEQITMLKINELAALTEKYRADGAKIEKLWDKFVAQGDKLSQPYQSADFYCDNVQQVKDWTMQGLTATCEQAPHYLAQIDRFQETFEFTFTKDVECRIQKLRTKIWDCRYTALLQLAKVEASPTDYQGRLKELMDEYGMGERPEDCLSN